MVTLRNSPLAKDFLEEAFPRPIRSQLMAALGRGYSIVQAYCEETPWLNWPVGDDLRGQLRRAAVDFEFSRLVEMRRIPLTCHVSPNALGNCHHLELLGPECVLTISQVDSPRAVPRRAVFRNNLSLSNQIRLPGFQAGSSIEARRHYCLLTHGSCDGRLSFARLGVPQPEVGGWIYQVDLLGELIALPTADVELVTAEDLVRFKEYARRVQSDGA